LRELLLAWDAIGVAGAPEAADEYDCMLSPLMHQLHEGADEVKIRDWLPDEVQEHFGMRTDPDREGLLANQIVEWWRGVPRNPRLVKPKLPASAAALRSVFQRRTSRTACDSRGFCGAACSVRASRLGRV